MDAHHPLGHESNLRYRRHGLRFRCYGHDFQGRMVNPSSARSERCRGIQWHQWNERLELRCCIPLPTGIDISLSPGVNPDLHLLDGRTHRDSRKLDHYSTSDKRPAAMGHNLRCNQFERHRKHLDRSMVNSDSNGSGWIQRTASVPISNRAGDHLRRNGSALPVVSDYHVHR